MICVSISNAKAPFDASQLYWVSGGRDAGPMYSPARFYFASADLSRLVPAMKDEERFIAALTDAIASGAGLGSTPGLQEILDALTAENNPPAPRYPQIGDTGVYGVAYVYGDDPSGFAIGFKLYQSPTPPDTFAPHSPSREWAQAYWTQLGYPKWVGRIRVFIGNGNHYDTPPATLAAARDAEIGVWEMSFRSNTAVTHRGRVKFDITEEGAVNVVNA